MPNRQARADGVLVSIGGTSLYHEAKAAGVIYQATLRRELHRSLGLEWKQVDESTGMASWPESIATASPGGRGDHHSCASEPRTTLRWWMVAKPEELAWAQLVGQWRADARGLHRDRAAVDAARAAFDRARLADAAEKN